MKAISLWQPWATLVAMKLKTIETRTHDRFKSLLGSFIAVHAGKYFDIDICYDIQFVDALLEKCRMGLTPTHSLLTSSKFNGGKILCTAMVMDVSWAHRNDDRQDWNKQALCQVAGKYCLFLGHIKPLKKPIPWRGRQGIFKVPDEVINAGV